MRAWLAETWEVPWSAICQLEAQGNWQHSSHRNPKPWEPEASASESRRGWMSQLCFLYLFVLFRSSTIRWWPPTMIRVIFFTYTTDLNANLFGDTLTDILRNNILLAILASLSPVNWHIKLTITVDQLLERISISSCVLWGKISLN